jgi:transposase
MPLDQTDPLWAAIVALLEQFNRDRSSGLISCDLLRSADELRLALWRDQRKASHVPLAPTPLPSRGQPDGHHCPA